MSNLHLEFRTQTSLNIQILSIELNSHCNWITEAFWFDWLIYWFRNGSFYIQIQVALLHNQIIGWKYICLYTVKKFLNCLLSYFLAYGKRSFWAFENFSIYKCVFECLRQQVGYRPLRLFLASHGTKGSTRYNLADCAANGKNFRLKSPTL